MLCRGNFLYDAESDMLHLIDFGASRDFPPDFVAVSCQLNCLSVCPCMLYQLESHCAQHCLPRQERSHRTSHCPDICSASFETMVAKPVAQDYMEMVKACADKDRDQVIARSLKLGFLSGALLPKSASTPRVSPVLVHHAAGTSML